MQMPAAVVSWMALSRCPATSVPTMWAEYESWTSRPPWCSISVLPKTAPAVLRALEAMVEVEEVSAVSGPFDYLVFLRCASHEQLDTLLDKVGQLDGVHQTQTSIVLSRKIDRRSVGA